ncbi:hypothetical protein D3C71_1197510 [compost metagenome]
MQGGDAFDGDGFRAGAGDLGTHGDQAIRQIDDFRLARSIVDDGRALGERRCHQQHMGRTDGDLGESVLRADETALGGRYVDITAVNLDLGAKRCKAFEEEVDRTRADGATTGQRDAGLAFTRQKRADDPEGGTHLRDQLIRSGGVDNGAAGELYGAGVAVGLAFAATVDGNIDAVVAENAQKLLDVCQMRHVFKRQGVAGQKRGDHQRQGGVLGAGNRNDAVQLVAAGNANAIHG